MQMNRELMAPDEQDELFLRWSKHMAVLDAALTIPKIEVLVPGWTPRQPVPDAWKVEMRRQTDMLNPLASEMADAYLYRLDAEGRQRARELLAAHRVVTWHFEGPIADYLERFLVSLDQADLDKALALIAIYDTRASSRDFHRLIYPWYLKLQKRGIDVCGLFEAALALTTPHEDPDVGAHGLFLRLSRRPEEETQS